MKEAIEIWGFYRQERWCWSYWAMNMYEPSRKEKNDFKYRRGFRF